MSGTDRIGDALRGRPEAVRALVDELSPVIQARVARTLLRRAGAARGRDVRQEIEDLTQEVFVALFRDDAKLLRAWDPERGMGIKGFVGLIAEQQVAQVLRSRRRSPWTEDPTDATDLASAPEPRSDDAETRLVKRQLIERALDEVRGQMSPRGLQIFRLLVVEQQTVEQVSERMDMRPDAVYAWRSRLKKRLSAARARIRGPDPQSEEVRP